MREELAEANHLTIQGKNGEIVRDLQFLLRASECCVLAGPDDAKYTAADLFKEYGLTCRSDGSCLSLSPSEKIRFSIVKAAAQGAKLLVLEDITEDASGGDVKELLNLLSRLKEKGVGMLIADNHPDYFFPVADRLYLMGAEGIERKLYDREEFALGLARFMGREEAALGKRKEAGEKRRVPVCFPHIALDGAKPFDLNAHGGEILLVSVKDGRKRRQLWDILSGEREGGTEVVVGGKRTFCRNQEELLKKKIAFWGYGTESDRVFTNLSAADNILLPSMKRIRNRFLGYGRAKNVLMADAGFIEPGLSKIDVKRLNRREKNKILLTRWKLFDPSVLFLYNIFSNADAISKEWMGEELSAMAARGTAVVMIEMDALAGRKLAAGLLEVDAVCGFEEGNIGGEIT